MHQWLRVMGDVAFGCRIIDSLSTEEQDSLHRVRNNRPILTFQPESGTGIPLGELVK